MAHIRLRFVLISIVLALASGLSLPAAEQTIGGVTVANSLKVAIKDDGRVGIWRYVKPSTSYTWQYQVYGSYSKGSRLMVGGTGYSMGYFSGTALTAVSNLTQVAPYWTRTLTVFQKSDSFQMDYQIVYPSNAVYAAYTWTLYNKSAAPLTDVRFFHGQDTYLAGGDAGSGLWDAEDDQVGVKKVVSGIEQRMTLQSAGIASYGHESRRYSLVNGSVNAGALSGAVDTNSTTDNGYALEWRTNSIPVGGSWTVRAFEKFNSASGTIIYVTAPVALLIPPGTTTDITFRVSNNGLSLAQTYLVPNISAAGWTAALISPTSPVGIPSVKRTNVVIRLTVPANATDGMNAKLALTATSGSQMGSDFADVTVTAPSAPVITLLGTNKAALTTGSLPSVVKGTDFGEQAKNSSTTRTLTITNTGTATLTLIAPTITGDGSTYFSVNGFPSSVGLGESASFNIVFNPTVAGTHTAAVAIVNNAVGASPYAFGVSGSARDAQTITFAEINPHWTGDSFAPGATASSGLTVSYAVQSGPATVSGANLICDGTGVVTVVASQAGSSLYTAAASVSRTFNISNALGTTSNQYDFTGLAGGSAPDNQTLWVTNNCGTSIQFSHQITYGSGSGWLTLTPASGETVGSHVGLGDTISVNLSSLSAGSYVATNWVTPTNGAHKPVPVVVLLTVTNAASGGTALNYVSWGAAACQITNWTAPGPSVWSLSADGWSEGIVVSPSRSDGFDGGGLRITVSNGVSGLEYVGSSRLRAEVSGDQWLTMPSNAIGSNLQIWRSSWYPTAQPLVRDMISIRNTSASDVTVSVNMSSDLGSDASETLQATSSGDVTLNTTDRWCVSDDSPAGADPALTFAVWQQGSLQPTTYSVASGFCRFDFSTTIPAGAIRRFVWFVEMNADSVVATNAARKYDDPNANNLFSDLPSGVCSEIVNWGAVSTPAPSVELTVIGTNGATVANGAAASAASGTDLGLFGGSTTQTVTLAVSNLYSTPVSISSMLFSGAGASAFSIQGVTPPGLTALTKSNVTVRFIASAVGTYNATLSINNNGAVSPYQVNLTAQIQSGGMFRVLGVNDEEIASGDAASVARGTDFGLVAAGVACTNTLVVTNLTAWPVTISGAGGGYFTVSGLPVTLAGWARTNMPVRFLPAVTGVHTALLSVAAAGTQIQIPVLGAAGNGPAWTSTPVTTGTVGQVYTYVLAATDPDGDPIDYSSIVLPAWLSIVGDAQSSLISTIAGTGSSAFSGDGNPAINAGMSGPVDVVSDGPGNIYVTDQDHNRIRKITAAGIISTIAGSGAPGFTGDGGLAVNARIKAPQGIARDVDGNIYFADKENHRIRKVAVNGVISTVAGSRNSGFAGDGGAATNASLNAPAGVCISSNGILYIADTLNHRVRKVTTNGIISTVAGTGAAGFSGDSGAATSATLNQPTRVRLDVNGNLYIADTMNHRVRKVNGAGTISTFAGTGVAGYAGDDGAATSAQLQRPQGLVLDTAGNLLIADVENCRIRRVSTGGIITTVAGRGVDAFAGDGGLATNACISLPRGVGLDHAGSIYFPDTGNKRIRKLGRCIVLTGTPGPDDVGTTSITLYAGDGTFSTPQTFPLTIAGVPGMLVKSSAYASMRSGVSASDTFGSDFGTVATNAAATNSFSVTNFGSAPLVISAVSKTGGGASYFQLTGLPATIAAGATQSFVVVYRPLAAMGMHTALVSFANNSATNPYYFNVCGAGVKPGEIGLNRVLLAFEGTYLGSDPAAQSLIITNKGELGFNYTFTASYLDVADWFTQNPTTGYLNPAAKQTMTVAASLSGLNAGVYVATNTVTSPTAINSPIDVRVQLTVLRAPQTITFAEIPTKTILETVTLSASASSGLPVSFALTSGPGTLTGNQLTFTNLGDVVITASQAGDTNWLPATSVIRRFIVTKATIPVTISNTNQMWDGNAKTVTVTTVPDAIPVVTTYDTLSRLPTNPATYEVETRVNHDSYAGMARAALLVTKTNQTISWGGLSDPQLVTNVVQLTATASSGLPVEYTVFGPAEVRTLNGIPYITFTGTGSVTVRVSQAGNEFYHAATPVDSEFIVENVPVTVFLLNLSQIYNGTPRMVTATTQPPALAVSFTYDASATAPVNAGSYAIVGTVTDPGFAGSANGTLVVGKADQAISFASPGDQFKDGIATLNASASSGLTPVTFGVSTPPALWNGTQLTFTDEGYVDISASQAGNGNWNPAPVVTHRIRVSTNEVQVLGTNLSMVSRSGPADLATGTDFGSRGTGSLVTNHFRLLNGGLSLLTVSAVAKGGDGASRFTIAGVPAGIVAGTASNFTIVYSPTVIGTDTALVSVTYDRISSPYYFNLSGTAVQPAHIGMAPASLSFTTEYSGANPADQTLTLSNSGGIFYRHEMEVIYGAGASGWLTASALNGTVEPEGSQVLTLGSECGGLSVGTYTATCRFTSAEADNAPLDVAVQLTITKANQTITFADPGNQMVENLVLLGATASSGMGVTYSVTGPAQIDSSGVLSFTSTGQVTVTAMQAGDANWNPAADVAHTFVASGVLDVNSDVGVKEAAPDVAVLSGKLEAAGGGPAQVYVCWGDDDAGGVVPTAWDRQEHLGTISGAATGAAFSVEVGGLQAETLYYYRCYASNSFGEVWSDRTQAWIVRPIERTTWYFLSMPVEWTGSSNTLGSRLGVQIASGLHAGTDSMVSDSLWFWNRQNSSWEWYWLSTEGWKDNADDPADRVMVPGEGFWVKRLTSEPMTNMVFAGLPVGTAATISFPQGEWKVFGWPYAPRSTTEGVNPGWGFQAQGASSAMQATTADAMVGYYNGRYFSIYLRPDGHWYTRGTSTRTSVKLEPGRAYYYYHYGNGSITWTPPLN